MIHFIQNLLAAKIHTSCKILKFFQHFGSETQKHMWAKFLEFDFSIRKGKVIDITRKKSSWSHIIFIYKSTMKLLDRAKLKFFIFWETVSDFQFDRTPQNAAD